MRVLKQNLLFPLDCANRLWRQVVENTVDALNLSGDAGGDFVKNVIWDFLNGCAHGVLSIAGYVDSQNSFGATVSTKFTIVLKVVREHPYYTVVSVTFD